MTGAPDRPKFFGRRKGRALKPSQQVLLEERLPALAIDPAALPSDPGQVFDPPAADLWLEIGFGAGEHLADQAARHPHVGMLGCEPYINGVVKLIRAAEAANLSNIRIFPDDARLLLDALPDACLGRVFVLFPDPWPKTRHHARRFIGPENLPRLARVLRPGGELRCATDHPGYLDWMLFHIRRHPAFDWTARRPADWRERPTDQPATRYETKALAGQPHYLTFRRA